MHPEAPTLQPTFLRRLADPTIRTVLLAGCGGGFDFVHSLLLYPELRRLGKQVVLGSYSFGDPGRIRGPAPVVFEQGAALVKRVTAACQPDPHYGPEVHVCSFLDQRFPTSAPHWAYAYYARAFTVPVLRRFYAQVVAEHGVDAVVLVDGGSDSLMRGDEAGLGDPVEDCVSVAAVTALEGVQAKLLVSAGLGCDRFNQVSDRATLRAVAELTAAGGFLGALALEPGNVAFRFYRACLDHIYERQSFRSVLAGAIVSAGEGHFGSDSVPERLTSRVHPGQLFLWPLMATLWAFDVEAVAQRSLMATWIAEQPTPRACLLAIARGRAELESELRDVEELPRQADVRRGATR